MTQRRSPLIFFALSFLLLTLGSCGAQIGYGSLQAGELAFSSAEPDPEEATKQALSKAWYEAPFRRPLAAANIVLSVLLMFSGVLLMLRKPSALWIAKQATLANAVWVVLDVGSWIGAFTSHSDTLRAALQAEYEAGVAGSGEPIVESSGGFILFMWVVVVVAFGIFRLGVYLWLHRRVGKPDIAAQLGPAPDERDG